MQRNKFFPTPLNWLSLRCNARMRNCQNQRRAARLRIFLLCLIVACRATDAAYAAKQQYILSGSTNGSANISVDDDLDVYLNGALIYTDGSAGSGSRPPMNILARVGDTLRFVVRDTFGGCSSLVPVYITDSNGRYALADPGFSRGCNYP